MTVARTQAQAAANTDFAHVFTAPGSGTLNADDIIARASNTTGQAIPASAAVTNPATRECTLTIADTAWRYPHGGFAHAQVYLTENGSKSLALDLTITVRRTAATRAPIGWDYTYTGAWV